MYLLAHGHRHNSPVATLGYGEKFIICHRFRNAVCTQGRLMFRVGVGERCLLLHNSWPACGYEVGTCNVDYGRRPVVHPLAMDLGLGREYAQYNNDPPELVFGDETIIL